MPCRTLWLLIFSASVSCQVCSAQSGNLKGTWSAEFKDSITSGQAKMSLDGAPDGSVSGSYKTNLGGGGTIAMRSEGSDYRFVLTQTVPECPGSFTGRLTVTNGHAEGTYSGNDCKGWHDNGTVSMRYEAAQSSPPASTTPSSATSAVVPNFQNSEYPLLIRVLQTDRVPYSVQIGSPSVSTNCSISGSTYTSGSATSIGNFTFGNATSTTDLGMHCNTYETQPAQWQHVLNTMLVVASNGNAYIIACDAAWRWSKCRGLVTGDTFRAKVTSKGLAVEYFDDKKKSKEATYSILQGKVLAK